MYDLANNTWIGENTFIVPVLTQFLVYAPIQGLAALVNSSAVSQLPAHLWDTASDSGPLDTIVQTLRSEQYCPPSPRQGDLAPPFLGLLPTRGCNLACRYCGFVPPGDASVIMPLRLARDAVDWYLDLVDKAGQREAEIHFFGGEPFCAPEILDLTVNLARIRAKEIGCTIRFEVATNGVFSQDRCHWAADNLDTIVLSFDGPAEIQNQHRPYKDGRNSFEIVARSAKILSHGSAQLFFRACVTAQTVDRLPEIAAWFCSAYHPAGVCFEPVQPNAPGEWGAFEPPDPWTFARQYIRAARVMETYGVEPVYATADISTRRVSFCPVGQDVVIVSPGGELSACYLLRQDWEARGMDLTLGRIADDGAVTLYSNAVAYARKQNVWNEPFCRGCFCKWHCAGGCHVNHLLPETPGNYDRLCLQTRIITLCNILASMGRTDLVDRLLADRAALEKAIWQPSDAILKSETRP